MLTCQVSEYGHPTVYVTAVSWRDLLGVMNVFAIEPTLHANASHVIFKSSDIDVQPLPASIDVRGLVSTEWVLTATELEKVLQGGHIRLWIHTLGHKLQPVSLEVTDPECGMRGE